MGKVYREALMDFMPSGPRVVVADGKIGEKSGCAVSVAEGGA